MFNCYYSTQEENSLSLLAHSSSLPEKTDLMITILRDQGRVVFSPLTCSMLTGELQQLSNSWTECNHGTRYDAAMSRDGRERGLDDAKYITYTDAAD